MWRCKTFMQIAPLILTPTGRLSLMMAHEIYLNSLMHIDGRDISQNLDEHLCRKRQKGACDSDLILRC